MCQNMEDLKVLKQYFSGGVADKSRMCARSQMAKSPNFDKLLRPFNLTSGGFLAAPPLISNCSNMPFGAQGRS